MSFADFIDFIGILFINTVTIVPMYYRFRFIRRHIKTKQYSYLYWDFLLLILMLLFYYFVVYRQYILH
jgi:predicted transporter